ncbi:hypothetical protein Hypma_005063 [Hypsizygus marmoreus]|uniref:DUF6699 domain-containing protein n=1 Tax=Hypsizygus marmoreus TaxID=39966 RepID=A0A369K343_HYPMA|nr:hypothetical protein Hypma_005063 [Hypsizygus marmoreus]
MSDSRIDNRAKAYADKPPDWNQYGGHYRGIDDLSTAWIASPLLDKPNTAAYFFIQPIEAPWERKKEEIDAQSIIPTTPPLEKKPHHRLARILQLLSDWMVKRNVADCSPVSLSPSRRYPASHSPSEHSSSSRAISRPLPAPHSPSEGSLSRRSPLSQSTSTHLSLPHSQDVAGNDVILPAEVQLREWKAWGYFARPVLNGVVVENYPPAENVPSSVNVEEIFASLVDPDGTQHAERWFAGLLHPAIPPRPKRWVEPRNGDPLPFPWECQLNPHLQHYVFGAAPIYWNVGTPLTKVFIGKSRRTLPITDSDLAQPATYPFVTHLYINALADDPLPFFPWPFMVYNPRGITVGDVFTAIFNNFQQYVSKHEFETWDRTRQFASQLTFEGRWGQAKEDGMRRCDFLGTHCWFRGLQPNPNREGWMMFAGIV